ncbi:C2 domain-containing protein [Aureococcus anophagefferens]|nr:C2 domain-containing protein [Aureococcus anophagefferens]
MWALPAALAVGVVLERAGCPLVVTSAIAALLALTSYLGERRAASLAAARKEREAEDLDQRFREAALASGVKISPREKILLEELDCRTWLDQALTTLGAAAPRVRRVVPVRLAEDGVVMLDLDVDWRGSGVDVDLSARLGGGWIGASVPLGLDHVSFKATLRVRCVLGDRSPFAALVDVAFARKPEVLDFGLSVISGDITGLPSIPALVSNALEGVIDGLMVWPRRLSFPLDEWWHPWDVPPAVAHGVLRLTVDRARDLPGADLDGKSDPFVVVEVGGADAGGGFEARETLRTATKSKTLNPTWDGEVFTLTIADPPSTASASPCSRARYGKPASTDDAEAARGEWFESHEFCGGVALGESRGEYADFSADGATLRVDVYDADPHGASEHLGAATFPLRDVDDAVGGAVWAPLAAPPGRAGAAGDVGSSAAAPRRIRRTASPASRRWAPRGRVDDSDDDDDDGTPKRTACVNFRRRSGDGGGVEPVPEAMTR